MEPKVLEGLLKQILKEGYNFDIRHFSLEDEKKLNDNEEFLSPATQSHYSSQLLKRIKEEINKETITPSLAYGIIQDIMSNPKGIYEDEHVFSNMTTAYSARIYLNPAIGESYYKFIEEFVVKGLQQGIQFEMKPSEGLGNENKKDGMVIYTTTEHLEKANSICEEIFTNNIELQNNFGTPPYGTITPMPYYGVCQNEFRKTFSSTTYNSYFNGVAKQAFTHLMISKHDNLKRIIEEQVGSEVLNKFLNYQPTYLIRGMNTDVVTNTFFSHHDILNLLDKMYQNNMHLFTEEFYDSITKFHSMTMYNDLEHQSHPAITDKVKFLEKYTQSKSNINETKGFRKPNSSELLTENKLRPAGDLIDEDGDTFVGFHPAGDLEPTGMKM